MAESDKMDTTEYQKTPEYDEILNGQEPVQQEQERAPELRYRDKAYKYLASLNNPHLLRLAETIGYNPTEDTIESIYQEARDRTKTDFPETILYLLEKEYIGEDKLKEILVSEKENGQWQSLETYRQKLSEKYNNIRPSYEDVRQAAANAFILSNQERKRPETNDLDEFLELNGIKR